MRKLADQPGNRALTAALADLTRPEIAAHCDTIRGPGPVPLDVLHHLLDDMAVLGARTDRWTCEQWFSYKIACPHGGTAWLGCPATQAA